MSGGPKRGAAGTLASPAWLGRCAALVAALWLGMLLLADTAPAQKAHEPPLPLVLGENGVPLPTGSTIEFRFMTGPGVENSMLFLIGGRKESERRVECRTYTDNCESALVGTLVSNGEVRDQLSITSATGTLGGELPVRYYAEVGTESYAPLFLGLSGFPMTVMLASEVSRPHGAFLASIAGNSFTLFDGCKYGDKKSFSRWFTAAGKQIRAVLSNSFALTPRKQPCPKKAGWSSGAFQLYGQESPIEALSQ